MNDRSFDIRISGGGRLLVEARDVPLDEGAMTFLFGESGIGKSLLGKALFGLLDEAELHVSVDGDSYARYLGTRGVAERNRNGFFMFQEPSSHLNPLLTIDEQLREGSLAGAPDPAASARELWSGVGSLERILDVYPKPYRPSGGEKQRILAAMAFTKMDVASARKDPEAGLFVFDEPTGSLDREARDRLLDRLFARFRRRRETIVLITHDYGMIGYVQSHHQDLFADIRFRELVLRGTQVVVRNFDPRQFTGWLDSQKHEERTEGVSPLLRVEGGVRVFGRTLRFSHPDAAGTGTELLVHPGEVVYLKAGSGVGKTTLAKIIIGLQKAEFFRMVFDGIRIGEVTPPRYWQRELWGRKMTMAFQHADEALNPRATVEESLRILPVGRLKDRGAVSRSLATLFDPDEVPRLLARKVWQLSGGQKQRLNLLRAFALETPLIILDEPLSALDFESIDRVLARVREARHRGQAILLISHNEDIFDPIVPPASVFRLDAF